MTPNIFFKNLKKYKKAITSFPPFHLLDGENIICQTQSIHNDLLSFHCVPPLTVNAVPQ